MARIQHAWRATAVASGVLADVEVNNHAVVIAGPDTVDRLVEGEGGVVDRSVGARVRMSRSDEDVVDPPMMVALASNLIDD